MARAECVLVRCGPGIAAFDADTGAPAWTLDLGGKGNNVFAPIDDGGVITDVSTGDGGSALAAVAADGTLLWRVELGGQAGRRGVACHHGVVAAVAMLANADHRLLRIDMASGRVISDDELPLGGHVVARIAAGWLVGNKAPDQDSFGLYVVHDDGEATGMQPYDVWNMAVRGRNMIVVCGRHDEFSARLECRDADTLELRWAADTYAEPIGVDDDRVIHHVMESRQPQIVQRDLTSGLEVWRGGEVDSLPTFVSLAGPYALVRHLDGLIVCLRIDGTRLAEMYGLWGFEAGSSAQHIYLANDNQLIAYALPSP